MPPLRRDAQCLIDCGPLVLSTAPIDLLQPHIVQHIFSHFCQLLNVYYSAVLHAQFALAPPPPPLGLAATGPSAPPSHPNSNAPPEASGAADASPPAAGRGPCLSPAPAPLIYDAAINSASATSPAGATAATQSEATPGPSQADTPSNAAPTASPATQDPSSSSRHEPLSSLAYQTQSPASAFTFTLPFPVPVPLSSLLHPEAQPPLAAGLPRPHRVTAAGGSLSPDPSTAPRTIFGSAHRDVADLRACMWGGTRRPV